MIDTKKPLRTVDGHSHVEFISNNGRNPSHPLLGYIGYNQYLSCWKLDGTSNFNPYIENIPEPPKKHKVYLYRYDDRIWASIESPDGLTRSKLIATCQITEGEFCD